MKRFSALDSLVIFTLVFAIQSGLGTIGADAFLPGAPGALPISPPGSLPMSPPAVPPISLPAAPPISPPEAPPISPPEAPPLNPPGSLPMELPAVPTDKLPGTETLPDTPNYPEKNSKDMLPKDRESPSSSNGDDPADDETEPKGSDSEIESQEDQELEERDHDHHYHHHEEDSFPAEYNGENVNYILLVSYFRSGSSFVGDLLQQPEKTFYTFEPLKFFDFNHKVDIDDEEEAIQTIQDILECAMDREEEFSDWICFNGRPGSSISRNHFLWESCEENRDDCCDPNYVDSICSQTRTRVVKETRISLESVEKLLVRLPKTMKVKVVFLVRDPRGIYNSRKHYKWCKHTSCIDYEQLCEDLTADLEVYPRLVKTFGERITIARFEDIALDPFAKGEALYKFLGLPYASKIFDFIDTHTDENAPYPNDSYSVIHNPQDIITKWVSKLNETTVNAIQDSCQFVFDQLGYKHIVMSEVPENFDDLNEIIESDYYLPNRL